MKKALAFVLTITMLFAFCTGMAEGWTAIEPNTGGESTQAEGGTGLGDITDDGYTEPEKIYGEGDEDYAISFAVPTDSKGITLIYGRQSCDTRKTEEYNDIDVGNKQYGGHR